MSTHRDREKVHFECDDRLRGDPPTRQGSLLGSPYQTMMATDSDVSVTYALSQPIDISATLETLEPFGTETLPIDETRLIPIGSYRTDSIGILLSHESVKQVWDASFSPTSSAGRTSRWFTLCCQGPRIVPAPRLIVDYAHNGHLSHGAARTLITTISRHLSWENSPYVTQLLQRLDE